LTQITRKGMRRVWRSTFAMYSEFGSYRVAPTSADCMLAQPPKTSAVAAKGNMTSDLLIFMTHLRSTSAIPHR
jgi:hypothetical protein